MVKTGVIHGRFQILHNDHLKYLMAGKARCGHLVVGITNPDPVHTGQDSADTARSQPEANPLTYFERFRMVNTLLLGEGLDSKEFSIVPFPINFPELYQFYVPLDAVFFLTIYDQWGENKLKMFQSLGLKTEVLWRRDISDKGLSSTAIRALITEGKDWEKYIPPKIVPLVKEFDLKHRINDKTIINEGLREVC